MAACLRCGFDLSLMEPLSIGLAAMGLLPTRAQTLHVLLTAEEVAAGCAGCHTAGAGMRPPGILVADLRPQS